MATCVNFDRLLREMFPAPGEPTKQWVLDARAARAELERTGARLSVPVHLDNTGLICRHASRQTLIADMAQHDCCSFCNGFVGA